MLLYHYNETQGEIVDSSGNGNNLVKIKASTREGGLFDTRSLKIHGQSLKIPTSASLNNIANQLTVETFLFLEPGTPEEEENLRGRVIGRKNSFFLRVNCINETPTFEIYTTDGTNIVRKRVAGDVAIPFRTWVHVAGVYDGSTMRILVNGIEQAKVKNITGNIAIDPTQNVFLGNKNLFARLEETRISNIARNDCPQGEIITQNIERKFFYSGWRVIEEQQSIVEEHANSTETFPNALFRHYIDGIGIDEHLTLDQYNNDGSQIVRTIYYHQNQRGDTVATTDANGQIIALYEYTTFGVVFEIEDDELTEMETPDEVVYTFQGRRTDPETGLMYYRNRYYNPQLGRFLQRDPLGYVDNYNLYAAFGGNPYIYSDPMGLDKSKIIYVMANEFAGRNQNDVDNINLDAWYAESLASAVLINDVSKKIDADFILFSQFEENYRDFLRNSQAENVETKIDDFKKRQGFIDIPSKEIIFEDIKQELFDNDGYSSIVLIVDGHGSASGVSTFRDNRYFSTWESDGKGFAV